MSEVAVDQSEKRIPKTIDGKVIVVGKEYWKGVDLPFTVRSIKQHTDSNETIFEIVTEDWEIFLLEFNPVYSDRKQVIQVEIEKHKKYVRDYGESIKRHVELIRDLESLL